ncbi:MAG: glycerol kinase GlpK [Eudoraea sp.]|nr:glycerol kinase GlpK [Eudoraea sp.]
MDDLILALDQGTTSCRALLFDKEGKVRATSQKEFTQHFPQPGWVEHDASEIWETQLAVAREIVGENSQGIKAIGITNQRETVVVWNKNSGEPVHHALVWQDKRTAELCDTLNAQGKAEWVREKTGLVIDAYFSGTKVKWILDNVEGAREAAEAGDLLMGTIDTWLIWKLTKGALHVTDASNACRTLLFNINTLDWDEELLSLLDIPRAILPEVRASSENYGNTHSDIFGTEIPIAGIAGDQQAALFGQMCTEKGMVKNTYGTGCFMLMNIGSEPLVSKNNLLTSVGWKIGSDVTYILEGSIFIGGAVVQWLRDGLKIIGSSSEVEALAGSVEDTGGVVLVPAFAGLGAPYWNQYAKGTIFGMTRGSTDAHIARAALESIAYQTRDVIKAMEADSGLHIRELRVDGGATVNNLLMQFQADVLQTETVRPKIVETTVMGAAFLAGLAVGYWSSIEEIRELWEEDIRFSPTQNIEKIDAGIAAWKKAVKALEYWTN